MARERWGYYVFILAGFVVTGQLLASMVKSSGEWAAFAQASGVSPGHAPMSELELALRPLSLPKRPAQPGDWLESHHERNQSFLDYVSERPVRPDAKRKVIHLCLVGDFTDPQRKIIDATREYMEAYFQVATVISKTIPLSEVPARAKRKHPEWGVDQLLSTYFLFEVLKPQCPEDALAYVAFTASDLWPGDGWNFVFGQASLADRTGIWSLNRHGNAGGTPGEYDLCLRRTIAVASHETGHILSIPHCIAFECNMNGRNHLEESDRGPLHACAICTRKLCWNLNIDPIRRFEALKAFYETHAMGSEVAWTTRALKAARAVQPSAD